MTDPVRLPDPVHLAQHLPRPCTLVYRHFGNPEAAQIAADASAICAARGLKFLISCDSGLPPDQNTGVHFPEKSHDAITDWRAAMPGRVFTAAAHTQQAAQCALSAGADAVFLSPVFDTRCDGANPALGVDRFTSLARSIAGPVYALGGINAENAALLRGVAAGIAVVSAISA